MCVIIYKPAGVSMPAKSILDVCHAVNKDGMGFCTPARTYRTMDYKRFTRALNHVGDDDPCLIHFRWATTGSVRIENCHPFTRGGLKFMHNGVLDVPTNGDKTDSETAFIYYICPVIQRYGWRSDEADAAIEEIAGVSRFAIMKGDDVELFGHWSSIGDGCLYSNLVWRYSKCV